LDNISGSLCSGSSLAILGASGAGKTTLLNFLSRKIQTSNLDISGKVLLNSIEVDDDKFGSISCYVMQDDVLQATMTPKEMLMFAAKMKLFLPLDEIEIAVRDLQRKLRLEKCQNTQVGSATIRGVSGGERKRSSIGIDLITNPSIIFLDEPTTGLDSYNSYELINLLNDLANSGRTIIYTIHQPSSEIFNLLSKICILALGKIVYFGDKEHVADYFDKINLPIPPKYNPFEHFIEMTNIVTVEKEEVLAVYPELKLIESMEIRYRRFVDIISKTYQDNIYGISANLT